METMINKKTNALVKVNSRPKKSSSKSLSTTKTFARKYDIVKIQKFVDPQGVSFRNVDDIQRYRTKKNTIDKSSKFGVNPSVYYMSNTDFKKPLSNIDVVKKSNTQILKKTSKSLKRLAIEMAHNAATDFNHDINRIQLVSKRNLSIAEVESLRLLTKAMIIEKNHHEQIYEKKCHEEALKNISLLKDALLRKNDKELSTLLSILQHDHEVELRNNDSDFARAKIKIQQKQEINDLKRKHIRERIKMLNQGEHSSWFKHTLQYPFKLIYKVKQEKIVPNAIGLDYKEDNLYSLISRIQKINLNSLSLAQAKTWKKFLGLVQFNIDEDVYRKRLGEIEDVIRNMESDVSTMKKSADTTVKSKKIVLVPIDQAKKIIMNANKSYFSISEPAKLYASNREMGSTNMTPAIKTKIIKIDRPKKINPHVLRDPIVKIKNFSVDLAHETEAYIPKSTTMYNDVVFQEFQHNFKKLQGKNMKLPGNLPFKNIEYTNYRWEWKDEEKRSKKQMQADMSYDNVQYQDVQDFLDGKKVKLSLNFSNKDFKTNNEIIRLQNLVSYLPKDPIVVKNLGAFSKHNLNIQKIIDKFNQLDATKSKDNPEVIQIIEDVKLILKIYQDLCSQDVKRRELVLKAQKIDQKLSGLIEYQDLQVASLIGNLNINNKKRIDAIHDRYGIDIENAHNQSLLNREYILDQEQTNYAREEETFLWNLAHNQRTSNQFVNKQNKIQNKILNGITSDILRFNQTANEPIDLDDLPSSIRMGIPLSSNAEIHINLETADNNEVYAIAENSECSGLLSSKTINTSVPKDVNKIYVLDKFRNVKDVKTKVALLNELANLNYLKALEQNEKWEKKALVKAQSQLDQKLIKINAIYDEVDTLETASAGLDRKLLEGQSLQKEYLRAKKERWKIYDRQISMLERKDLLEEKEKNELTILKQQKSKSRFDVKTSFRKPKASDAINIDDIIGKKR